VTSSAAAIPGCWTLARRLQIVRQEEPLCSGTAPEVPAERRESRRLPLEQEVLLSYDVATPTEIVARGLDLSPRGVRVQLPFPVPAAVEEVQLALRPADTRTAARIGRRAAGGHELVLVFSDPSTAASLLARAIRGPAVADGAPLGQTTAEHALGRASDAVSLVALLARSGAAHANRAWVCSANDLGWTVVESDGLELRWGARMSDRGGLGSDALFVIPVGDEPHPLLLMVEGQLRPEDVENLERLASLAARVWKTVAPNERRFLAWCALRLDVRGRLLDGLEDRKRAVREANLAVLARHGVDVMGYTPDLPRAARTRLRRQIEEMANFREWWLENVLEPGV